MHLGPGPVFAYEWLTTTRRWQLYAMRAGFVGTILCGILIVWHSSNRFVPAGRTVSIQMLATYGESLYETIVTVELTLVLLAAPAATAGAICLDKARGTLDHMLATDLSNAEIVLGKIGVRLIPVLGLVACVLPVTALTSLLGGIDPTALVGSFLTSIGCAILGCSLALILSVWGRKTQEVLMTTYLIVILWLIGPILGEVVADLWGRSISNAFGPTVAHWVACSNPYYLSFAPYTDPGKVALMSYLAFLTGCCLLSALFLGLATARIRRVALRQAGPRSGKSFRSRLRRYFPSLPRWPALPGPSLDGNPVLWREWHRSRPSPMMRVVWLLYSALGVLWLVFAFKVVVDSPANQEVIAMMCAFHVSVGLLLLSVNAATSLAEERVRGSLDALLCTPLSTRSILAGKWWGSFRQALPVLIWSVILAGILVLQSGHWVSYALLLGLIVADSAVITSLGLLIATWVSRLGRAVALCVSAYVVFTIGWLVLVFIVGGPDHFLLPLIMGSPPYGTGLATMMVAPEDNHFAGRGTTAIGFGALCWTAIDGVVAVLLFLTTSATFDRCLGRVSEAAGRPPSHPRSSTGARLDIPEWFLEDPDEGPGTIPR